MRPISIFISSVQKEFAKIRMDLKAFLLGDAVLRRFVSEVFLFEEIPAKDRRANEVYLEEVARCDIYIGLFGYEYGSKDVDGLSATEREYNHATELGKTRLIYVWGSDEKSRDARMKKLINKAGSSLVRRRIEDGSALVAEVYASLVEYLDTNRSLRVPPFDTSVFEGVTMQKLSRKRIEWFLDTARRERGFPLKRNTAPQSLLTHLNLLEHKRPTNAALLLFGSNPQQFHRTAETKCVHCHGTAYRRPFASQQIYSGDLFEQADQAREFVLSRINRSVGVRSESNIAPAEYELPPDAVGEAVVNAVAHRDYNSNASVEVRLFSDRLEVWNPGRLPGTLTTEDLRTDHPSVPNNPLIAEPMYLARYIEKAGSGTQRMIELCLEAGLPEPDFEQRSGSFVVTLWRDWLTAMVIAELNLNQRQIQGIMHVKISGRISTGEYRSLTNTSESTALRELRQLTKLGVLDRVGTSGRAAHYVVAKAKPAINPSNPSGENE